MSGARLVQRTEHWFTQVYAVEDLYGDDKVGTAIVVWRHDLAELGYREECLPWVTSEPNPFDDVGVTVKVTGLVRGCPGVDRRE